MSWEAEMEAWLRTPGGRADVNAGQWQEYLRRSREAMEEAARRPLPPFRPFSPFTPISPPAPPRTPSPASAPAPAPLPAPPDPGPPPDLKAGDEVEAKFGKEWVRAMVEAEAWRDTPLVLRHPRFGRPRWAVFVRRKGAGKAGQRYPIVERWADEVRLVRKYDPTTANVFADYLEEHGFAEAADALRAAFPLAPSNQAQERKS